MFSTTFRVFAGLGGGWLRVRGGSDWLPAGGDGSLGIFAQADRGFPGVLPPIEVDFRVTQRRNVALYGGSVGFTYVAGNLVVRPRVDMYWFASRLWTAEVAISDPLVPFLDSTIRESVKPKFVLVSVDFGFGFPR